MVSIDYRLEYDVSREQIFDMFKSMDYIHLRTKKRAVKKGHKWIAAEEFLKESEEGRMHIFVEFSSKSSGTEAYPQIDIHAHYDYVKKDGKKEYHITRRNIMKDLGEMYNIHDTLKILEYGYMEYKSRFSAHDTIRTKDKEVIIRILKRSYKNRGEGKYKKTIPDGQITFQIIEQHFFSHTVCVYALGEKHDLNRDEALKESNKIMRRLDDYLANLETLIKEKNDLLDPKEVLKSERDVLNLKTKELIKALEEKEEKIVNEKNWKNKKAYISEKRKIEKQLIKNKKLANQKHKEYLEFIDQLKQVKNQIKRLKKRYF